jgi:hypothetical protein
MADAPVVHIGENSPEQVALKLTQIIAANEGKHLHGSSVNADRAWLIRTYCMCLMAVKQPGYPDDALKVGKAPAQ